MIDKNDMTIYQLNHYRKNKLKIKINNQFYDNKKETFICIYTIYPV